MHIEASFFSSIDCAMQVLHSNELKVEIKMKSFVKLCLRVKKKNALYACRRWHDTLRCDHNISAVLCPVCITTAVDLHSWKVTDALYCYVS